MTLPPPLPLPTPLTALILTTLILTTTWTLVVWLIHSPPSTWRIFTSTSTRNRVENGYTSLNSESSTSRQSREEIERDLHALDSAASARWVAACELHREMAVRRRGGSSARAFDRDDEVSEDSGEEVPMSPYNPFLEPRRGTDAEGEVVQYVRRSSEEWAEARRVFFASDTTVSYSQEELSVVEVEDCEAKMLSGESGSKEEVEEDTETLSWIDRGLRGVDRGVDAVVGWLVRRTESDGEEGA